MLLDYRHDLPVESVLILLRPQAGGAEITGRVERRHGEKRPHLSFEYRVLRLWEQPVESILSGPAALLPLAPLAQVRPEELPQTIRTMEARIQESVPDSEAADIWAATFILMGLKYDRDFAASLLKGVRKMLESSTYRAIVEEGAENEARKLIILLGTRRFGPLDEKSHAKLDGITSIDHLERLGVRLLEVEGWDELLSD